MIIKIPEPTDATCGPRKAPPLPPRRGNKPRKRSTYYRWAELLKRVFDFDVLICDACKGPRKILAFLTQPSVIQKILEHCGLARDKDVLAPARSPPGFEDEFFA